MLKGATVDAPKIANVPAAVPLKKSATVPREIVLVPVRKAQFLRKTVLALVLKAAIVTANALKRLLKHVQGAAVSLNADLIAIAAVTARPLLHAFALTAYANVPAWACSKKARSVIAAAGPAALVNASVHQLHLPVALAMEITAHVNARKTGMQRAIANVIKIAAAHALALQKVRANATDKLAYARAKENVFTTPQIVAAGATKGATAIAHAQKEHDQSIK